MTPFSNVPTYKPHTQFLATIFGKKGVAYLWVFTVNNNLGINAKFSELHVTFSELCGR